MVDYLSVTQAAAIVGASPSLLQKRCKDGSIPCIRVGKQYRILRSDLDAWITFVPKGSLPKGLPESSALEGVYPQIERWLNFLVVTEKAPTTVANYRCYLGSFIKRLSLCGRGIHSPAHLYQRDVLATGFESMKGKSRSLKQNTVIALTSFGKFLVSEGVLKPDALSIVRDFKPSRGSDPRRTSLKSADLPKLFQAISICLRDPHENVTLAAMVGTMLYAGLRVSEVCNLKIKDVSLEERVIAVRHGKGRKDRQLGIRKELLELLTSYLQSREQNERISVEHGEQLFFIRGQGKPWNKDRMARRMQKISKVMQADITCHGLRRTFATLAAAQGRSVNYLRIALGHTSLAATEAYLRTTEAEVCEAMRNW